MAPRRSSRLKENSGAGLLNPSSTMSEQDTVVDHEDDDATFQDQASEAPEERPRKRSKRTDTKNQNTSKESNLGKRPAKRTKAILGNLKALPEMPIDILHEIFLNLGAIDLLYLMRTSKAFWSVLSSRSALYVWKECIGNSGLPPCPEDMSPQSWVDLCVLSHCQMCDSGTAKDPIWELRARVCSNCMGRGIGLKIMGYQRKCEEAYNCPWTNLVPYHHKCQDCAYVLSKEYDDVKITIHRLSNSGDTDALDKYVMLRIKRTHRHQQMAHVYSKWKSDEQVRQKKRNDEVRKQRRQDIIDMLTQLSWGPEIQRVLADSSLRQEFDQHRLINVSKPVSDKNRKNVEVKMVEFIQSLRRKRLESLSFSRPREGQNIVEKIYQSFCAGQPLERFRELPHVEDIISFPEFHDVVYARNAEDQVCEADFARATEALPRLCREWQEAQTIKALEMISYTDADGNLVMAPHDQLCLARTLFDCSSCREPIEFARFMHHEHGHSSKWCINSRWKTLREGSFQKMSFSSLTAERARWIITKCGLDPATATVEEMDDLGTWFRCQLCGVSRDGSFHVMNWRQAIEHLAKQREDHDVLRRRRNDVDGDSVTYLQLLDGLDKERADAALAKCKPDVVLWCTRCDIVPRHPDDHLKRAHGLDRPIQDGDYVRPPVCTPIPFHHELTITASPSSIEGLSEIFPS